MLQGDAQQILEAFGDEGAAKELDRIGVLGAADAAMHQIKISLELGLLVAAIDHIRVGGDQLAPGDEARLDLVLDRGLVAGAVAGPIGEDLLLQLLAHGADRIGLLAGVDVAAKADGGVEVAVDVVRRQGCGVGPLVAAFLEFADVGPV